MPHPPPPFLPSSSSAPSSSAFPLRIPLLANPSFSLTPYVYTPSEAADLIALQNQPLIGLYSFARPFPYTAEYHEDMIQRRRANREDGMRDLITWLKGKESENAGASQGIEGATEGGEQLPPTIAWPFGCLRYLPDPTNAPTDALSDLHLREGEVIGLAFIAPAEDFHHIPPDSPEYALAKARPRSEQVWGLGYDLDARLHGKGLGKDMLKRVLEWTDWLGVQVAANIQTDNAASSGLVKRMGFRLTKVEEWEWKPEKGGGIRNIGEWVRPCGGWTAQEEWGKDVPFIPLLRSSTA